MAAAPQDGSTSEVLARLNAFLSAYDAMKDAYAVKPDGSDSMPGRPLDPLERLEGKLDAIAAWVQSIDRRFAVVEDYVSRRVENGSGPVING